MNCLGVNILAQYVRNTSALMDFLRRSDPAAVVVMDSPPMAAAIHAQNPKATVIHRAYSPDDSHWQDVTDPQSWLNANAQHGGVVSQCMNEPAPGDLDKFQSWLEDVVRLAPPDVVLALPNFAVGNPHENGILAGVYDRILRLVCGTRHILALHEYFKDDAVLEAPYLCGRYTYWQKRAQALNLPLPRLVITEHGRDIGGGRNDGWQGAGWSEAEYFQRLASAQKSVYEYAVPVTIYCWGTGANNDWLSFDIEDANDLQGMIVRFGQEHPLQSVTPVPPQPPVIPSVTPLGLYTLTSIPALYVNVRAAPIATSADVGDLRKGDVVQRFAPDVNGWTYVEKDALKGWVSLQNGAVQFTPVTAPAPLFRLKNPVGCAHIISAKFGVPRDYDGDGVFEAIHEGLDITRAHADCTPLILNGHDGIVSDVSATGAYGLHVKVKSTVGVEYTVWFCHMAYIFDNIAPGKAIAAGHPIGIMGTTGNSTGVHLHLNVQKDGAPTPAGSVVPSVIDPEKVIEW